MAKLLEVLNQFARLLDSEGKDFAIAYLLGVKEVISKLRPITVQNLMERQAELLKLHGKDFALGYLQGVNENLPKKKAKVEHPRKIRGATVITEQSERVNLGNSIDIGSA